MDLSLSSKRRGYDIESLIGDENQTNVRNADLRENCRKPSGYLERATKQVSGE